MSPKGSVSCTARREDAARAGPVRQADVVRPDAEQHRGAAAAHRRPRPASVDLAEGQLDAGRRRRAAGSGPARG